MYQKLTGDASALREQERKREKQRQTFAGGRKGAIESKTQAGGTTTNTGGGRK